MTANDRFKESFTSWFWGSMILATVAHFAVLNLWPELSAEVLSTSTAEILVVELPPDVVIPPDPDPIARPASPVVSATEIDENITISPTTFENNPVDRLPPPPDSVIASRISETPTFTPFTVRPEVRNLEEVRRALAREYPPLLRDAGIGGSVEVWFQIDEEGVVRQTLVKSSSGHEALDRAALMVADVIEFSPALNRDKRVPVWISLTITFNVRGGG